MKKIYGNFLHTGQEDTKLNKNDNPYGQHEPFFNLCESGFEEENGDNQQNFLTTAGY